MSKKFIDGIVSSGNKALKSGGAFIEDVKEYHKVVKAIPEEDRKEIYKTSEEVRNIVDSLERLEDTMMSL